MKLHINGNPKEVAETSLPLDTYLLQYEGITPDASGIAVAINGQVVPRGQWASRTLAEGDRLEVVRAFQGG
ncbi:MAG: sulfur carrier protein ThiS [Sphingobacteriia bacterium]